MSDIDTVLTGKLRQVSSAGLMLNVARIASTVLVAGSMPLPVFLLERIEGRPDGLPAEILQYMPSAIGLNRRAIWPLSWSAPLTVDILQVGN